MSLNATNYDFNTFQNLMLTEILMESDPKIVANLGDIVSESDLNLFCKEFIRLNFNQLGELNFHVVKVIFSAVLDNVDLLIKSLSQIKIYSSWQDTVEIVFVAFGWNLEVFGFNTDDKVTIGLSKVLERLSFMLDKPKTFNYLINQNNDSEVFFAKRPNLFMNNSGHFNQKDDEDKSWELMTFADYLYLGLALPNLAGECLFQLIEQYSKLYPDEWMFDVTNENVTWLHRIANFGRYDLFQLFLKHYKESPDANHRQIVLDLPLNYKTTKGQNLLHSAILYSSNKDGEDIEYKVNFIKELIRDFPGFDINEQDDEGFTPLHLFIKSMEGFTGNNRDALKVLLDLGANPNIPSYEDGLTPLHSQIKERGFYDKEEEIAQLLIQYGADVHQKDTAGETPYSLVEHEIQRYKTWVEMQQYWKDLLKFMHQHSSY